jgi:hypothetical protein
MNIEKDYCAFVSAAHIQMHGHGLAKSSRQKFSCPVPSFAAATESTFFRRSFPVVWQSVEKQYVHVGEAYVLGIMKCETMEDFITRKYGLEYFELL